MSSDPAVRQSVLDLLSNFRGLDRLKDLFWTELNYVRSGRPLSRRGWPSAVAELLADDPVLLATAGPENEFHVVYCRLRSALSVADERKVVTRLLAEHPYALFVFSNEARDAWHFVNVKVAVPGEGEESPDEGRRRLYRRITVAPGEVVRTATERLAMLDVESIPGGAGASALALQARHDEAFDVEAVTRAFYDRYRKTFDEVERSIAGFEDNPDGKRLFTQRLFNRLMFTVFVQKKGWLPFQGARGSTDYLNALWAYYRARQRTAAEPTNFYREHLYLLFHHVFNRDHNIAPVAPRGWLMQQVGTDLYLNGGLYEEDDLDRAPGLFVPDHAISLILHDLFGRFNFTIAEASPLEVEVAVDPEMLGKVFEELVTGRHESGSYYTPKNVVSFMCREALKGYLRAELPHEPEVAITRFVEHHEPEGLRDGEAVLEALRRVTVCDPACGSGAYLLGMLHELLDLREALFNTRKLDTASVYERKLEIIQNNVFGVDIDRFAVDTARMRLWLSLVVDFERADPDDEIPPLPNLDFKIEEGDSLGAPMAGQLDLSDAVVREVAEAKADFLRAHHGHKREARARVDRGKEEIRLWARGGGKVEGFDWIVEFTEVFADRAGEAGGLRSGGFDIVLANPPYVRQELIRVQKPLLSRNFQSVYSGTADLYVFFYARALELLAPGGMLVFISPNKWFRAAYGAKLREHMAENTRLVGITDFGDLPVFASAAAYPMIFVARKATPEGGQRPVYTRPASLGLPYPDIATVVRREGRILPEAAIAGDSWSFAGPESASRLGIMRRAGMPLAAYVEERIYYGIKTGLNDAFVIDGATRGQLLRADPGCAAIIKPLVMGKDVHRWRIAPEARWLIFTRRGVDIDRYPAVREHLERWRAELEPKPRTWPADAPWQGRKAGRYRWYEIQDDVAYFGQLEQPKIVFPDIAKEMRFAWDETGAYLGNTCYFIASADLYLLALLNTAVVQAFYEDVSAQIRGGYLRFFRQYLAQIPIPIPHREDRDAIAELAWKCVGAADKSGEVGRWEAEINDRVAFLYGLASVPLKGAA